MIGTVTLNPCVDRTIEIDGFIYGETNKVISTREDISGKGINVSIVLEHLGIQTRCYGFNYLDSKNLSIDLKAYGLKNKLVDVAGTMRTNIKIFDSKTKVMTECNERGEQVSLQNCDALFDLVVKDVDAMSLLVLDGSVPPGVPVDFYRKLIDYCNRVHIPVVLDTAGAVLAEALKASPFLIKPNKFELEQLLEKELTTLEDIKNAGRQICKTYGVKYVVISLGEDGAMLVSLDSSYYSDPLKLNIKGVQGAGDSMVAGCCVEIQNAGSEADILRSGVAAASASLLRSGTKLCLPEDYARLMSEVVIKELD